MAHIRIRPNGRIQFDLHIYGQRFREGTKLMATPVNIKKANATLKKINAEIDLDTFQYRDYFPESKKVAKFEALQREKHPDRLYPFFNDYANEWFDRQKAKWKSSYQSVVRNTLDRYLIPEFGNSLVNEIKLANVDYFRESLMICDIQGARKLSNKRINGILWPFVAILSLAAEEHDFTYPLRRYKPLKEERANSLPLTADEVQRFLECTPTQWRDYFTVRFWTGMRSCEIHGLRWEDIDFNHRLIRIRHNWVNGELGDVKTPKSRRDLKMCDTLLTLFKRLPSLSDYLSRLKFNHYS